MTPLTPKSKFGIGGASKKEGEEEEEEEEKEEEEKEEQEEEEEKEEEEMEEEEGKEHSGIVLRDEATDDHDILPSFLPPLESKYIFYTMRSSKDGHFSHPPLILLTMYGSACVRPALCLLIVLCLFLLKL